MEKVIKRKNRTVRGAWKEKEEIIVLEVSKLRK